MAQGTIRIGIGGWVYEPWRGTFFPEGLSQKKELEYASRKLTSIEVNGTYYGSQKPETFAKWRSETPDGFIFSLKGPRFATNRRILAEGASSVERFLMSGITELKEKLGPINWQFMATKTFDPEDFESFFKLLPKSVEGHQLHHAVEVRHESFQNAEFVDMARHYGVAVITAGGEFPQIADITGPFVYLRLMDTVESEAKGYSAADIKAWADRARRLASGTVPSDMKTFGKPATPVPRDVFVYIISGFKERNPLAAMALIDALR
jgi:uncharacterized protein YecE (DUF72 family)